MDAAVDLLATGPEQFDVFVKDIVTPEDVPAAIGRRERSETMKVLVDCRQLSGAGAEYDDSTMDEKGCGRSER
jgi:hypothetical protein